MTNIQAVAFDLYDTLIYIADKTNPYLKLFLDLKLTPREMRLGRKIALTENFENLAEFTARLKPQAQPDLTTYEEKIKKEAFSSSLYPETKDVLKELKKRNLKLGLISNLASPYKNPFFELGLDKYFNEVLFSCDIGLKKPDPKIYQKIAQHLNINPSKILMTGDSIRADVDGPRSIGINAIHLDRINSSPSSIHSLEGIFQCL